MRGRSTAHDTGSRRTAQCARSLGVVDVEFYRDIVAPQGAARRPVRDRRTAGTLALDDTSIHANAPRRLSPPRRRHRRAVGLSAGIRTDRRNEREPLHPSLQKPRSLLVWRSSARASHGRRDHPNETRRKGTPSLRPPNRTSGPEYGDRANMAAASRRSPRTRNISRADRFGTPINSGDDGATPWVGSSTRPPGAGLRVPSLGQTPRSKRSSIGVADAHGVAPARCGTATHRRGPAQGADSPISRSRWARRVQVALDPTLTESGRAACVRERRRPQENVTPSTAASSSETYRRRRRRGAGNDGDRLPAGRTSRRRARRQASELEGGGRQHGGRGFGDPRASARRTACARTMEGALLSVSVPAGRRCGKRPVAPNTRRRAALQGSPARVQTVYGPLLSAAQAYPPGRAGDLTRRHRCRSPPGRLDSTTQAHRRRRALRDRCSKEPAHRQACRGGLGSGRRRAPAR